MGVKGRNSAGVVEIKCRSPGEECSGSCEGNV